MHILDTIVAHKKAEVQKLKALLSLDHLKKEIPKDYVVKSMKASILQRKHGGIIAEFKKKSPSKKNINLTAKVDKIIPGYCQAEVAGISVLTDAHFFGGNNENARQAVLISSVPILRKEFVIDPYQIYETKAIGAHTILLIARILSQKEMIEYTTIAHDLGLEVLVEIHNQEELDKCPVDMDIIGVNNRNLDTFQVDYQNSIKLKNQLPQHLCKISESGIHNTDTMVMLRKEGFDGFLIGEFFMATQNPGESCQQFLQDYRHKMEAI